MVDTISSCFFMTPLYNAFVANSDRGIDWPIMVSASLLLAFYRGRPHPTEQVLSMCRFWSAGHVVGMGGAHQRRG